MKSFSLRGVGNVESDPERVTHGYTTYTRFCLVATDYGGRDEEGAAREVFTRVWFHVYGDLGVGFADHVRKGDQLIVDAYARGNCDPAPGGAGITFVVQGYVPGAKGKR